MRLATASWGVQILAETDADAILLRAMQARLPVSAERRHRTGQVYEICPEVADKADGFTADEIAASKHAIEIRV